MMITLDFETSSECDLRVCGPSVYGRHPSTQVMYLVWSTAFGYGGLWKPGDPLPTELFKFIEDGELIEAHNVFFERNIWHHVCRRRMSWPDIPFEQWRCSMAACCRLTLPRSLDQAGKALKLDVQKDEIGHRIMMRLCKPTPQSTPDNIIWDRDPEKIERLYQYCQQDVAAEMAISGAIDPLTPSELKVWQLDQRINLRGIAIDRPAIEHAMAIVDQTYADCCEALNGLTGGVVSTPKQVEAMRKWIASDCGEEIPDLRKNTVETWLSRDDLPETTHQVLKLREQASKASTSKLKAMLARCDNDGRVRGNLVYHGASTGRWAGSGIQIQNFPRGTLSPEEVEFVHGLLPMRSGQALDLIVGNPMDCISSALRSMIVAEPGNRLLVCDFAQIEARVLAWIAGQSDLLGQFAAGDDVYVAMASKIYDVPEEEITKDQRFIGKSSVLGCGYGMGWRKFKLYLTMNKREIDNKLARQVIKTYRNANDAIVALWRAVGTACIRAIETGQPHRVGRLEITADKEWMKIKLPSGRQLHYREPHLVEVVAPWSEGYFGDILFPQDMKGNTLEQVEEKLEYVGIDLGARKTDRWVECDVPKGCLSKLQRSGIQSELEEKEPQMIQQIQFWAVGLNKKWMKERTYGGDIVQSITQGIARDFLCEAMLRVEAADYPIIATVHDEVISEAPESHGSLDDFNRIMRQIPTWGRGCPIEVEGYEAKRYRK